MVHNAGLGMQYESTFVFYNQQIRLFVIVSGMVFQSKRALMPLRATAGSYRPVRGASRAST
jgi:hypothetical protein